MWLQVSKSHIVGVGDGGGVHVVNEGDRWSLRDGSGCYTIDPEYLPAVLAAIGYGEDTRSQADCVPAEPHLDAATERCATMERENAELRCQLDVQQRSHDEQIRPLVEYFSSEGYSEFGWRGDESGWSTYATAIDTIKRLVVERNVLRDRVQKAETAMAKLQQPTQPVSEEDLALIARCVRRPTFNEGGVDALRSYLPRLQQPAVMPNGVVVWTYLPDVDDGIATVFAKRSGKHLSRCLLTVLPDEPQAESEEPTP